MTLSTSRQQFLAYESHNTADEIQYGRRGGVFISTCICISFMMFAVVAAVLVGVIVYYITYFKLPQKAEVDFWDENEPFSQSNLSPSPDSRLPSNIAPSFYRLKLKADLEKFTFTGNISITIRATKKVKEIILHAKNLTINKNAKLTEQIYEKVGTLHLQSRNRRDIPAEDTTVPPSTSEVPPTTLPENTTPSNLTEPIANITDTTEADTTTTEKVPEIIEPVTQTTRPLLTQQADTSVVHSNVRNINIISIKHGTKDRLILTLGSILKPNVDYTLELSFDGTISDSMTGLYKSSYVNSKKEVKHLASTYFEPISARAAFPCFDEPAFKAKFEISIAHSTNISALSNMKVSSIELISEEPGWQWTHFERSVRMSTYLVAYVLSDFQSLETSYVSTDNTTKVIKVSTRPEVLHTAKHALSLTPKILRFYEEFFGVPYVLDKMDLIAIPDFGSGAMENWGLVAFHEMALLHDEKEHEPRHKLMSCIALSHELAHQWFGNLVTMDWWTDVWVNEGFATYIMHLGIHKHCDPDWFLNGFDRGKKNLMRTDALKNTSPVSKKVLDASDLSLDIHEIPYEKGASLIRMLNHTLTEPVFRKGITIYLETWKYKNAEENDLWKAMSSAVDASSVNHEVSIVDFMNKWTRQPGYPVVRVDRNYYTGDVKFEQNIFTTDKNTKSKLRSQLWYIPISYTDIDTPVQQWSTEPKLWLKERDLTTHLPLNHTQALYVNVDAIGYYRVNYDQQNWELLSTALKTGQINSPAMKAQLIDDAFNLAKLGQLNYTLALELTTYLIDGEDSHQVWCSLIDNLSFFKLYLRKTSGYVYFQDYMKLLLKKQLEKLNYGENPPRYDNEAFLIETLLLWACSVGDQRCLAWTQRQFQQWTNQTHDTNKTIPSYLRMVVYKMALKHGGRREFEFLWNAFNNETDPTAKDIIIKALPNTREESLITMLLENSLTIIPKQYAASVWSVEPPVCSRVAQDFLISNFDRVYETFTNVDPSMFASLLEGSFGHISDEEELIKFKSFALKHKDKLMPMSQTIQKLVDMAKLRIEWMKYTPTINKWFKDYLEGRLSPKPTTNVPPNATTITSEPSDPSTSTTAPSTSTTTGTRSTTTSPISETSSNTTSTTNTTSLDPTLTTNTTSLDPTLTTNTTSLDPTLTTNTTSLDPTLTTNTTSLDPTLTTNTTSLDPTLTTNTTSLDPTLTSATSSIVPESTPSSEVPSEAVTETNSNVLETTNSINKQI